MLYYIILYYIILYKDTSICTYLYIYTHIHTYILYIHLSIYTYIHIHIDHWPTQIQRLGCNGIGRVASSHEAPRSLLNITHPQMIYVQEWRVSLLWTYSFHTAIERAEDGEKTNMFDDAWCMYCIYVYIFLWDEVTEFVHEASWNREGSPHIIRCPLVLLSELTFGQANRWNPICLCA